MSGQFWTVAGVAVLVGATAVGLWTAPVVEAPRPPQSEARVSTAVSDTFDGETREALHGEIRAYLLSNPEIVMEMVGLIEARQQADAQAAEIDMVRDNADALFDDGFSYVGGNPEGDITIVEFLDYQCGFCKRAHDEVATLIEQDGNIRYIVKELPILGPMSTTAAQATLAVLENDGPDVYKAFNDALMRFGGRLNDQIIDRLAERSGADVEAMRSDMDSREVERQIAEVRTLAGALNISGTPTFVIGDTVVRGYMPLPRMQETVELVRRVGQ